MATSPTADQSFAEQLHRLFEDDWRCFLEENPLAASEIGEKVHADRWPDLSPEAFEARQARHKEMLRRAEAIDASRLSASDRISLQLFRRKHEDAIEAHQYRLQLLPLTARDGIQDATFVVDGMAFDTVEDYEAWLLRLERFPTYMDQTLDLMREGIRTGMIHAEAVMRRVPKQIEAQIVDRPEASPFFGPFRRFPQSIDEGRRGQLCDSARAAIITKVIPSYERMLDFFLKEYLPACTPQPGAWQWPRGEEMYAYLCRAFTTTPMTPREIHDLGLEEVQRIHEQMQAVVDGVGHSGTFNEFLEKLRNDPDQYYATGEELLAGYEQLCKRIDTQLPKLFRRLPRVWYDIRPIPDNLAPDTTAAYYRPLSADGRRMGSYFVNLYRPEVRPKYEMEALSLHEAVPGHHLQIALATELEGLPDFRRLAPEGEYTGYVEGWALYAESLGDRLGCYTDPYSEFGRLTYDMWRAVRLVVDTGIHAFRWSREKAIDYFATNAAKTLHDIENEVDRYIAWPGQAVAYKVGEVAIRRLRDRAQEALGDVFDLPEFHDVLLRDGAVPLDLLEENVETWIQVKVTGDRKQGTEDGET